MDKEKMEKENVFEALVDALESMKIEIPIAAQETNEHCISEVNVLDFGAGAGKDNTAAFQRALSYCKKNAIHKLTVPKGTYHFTECPSHAHLPLDGLHDFVLDGQGSEFVFESLKSYISILKSDKVMVKNLSLDWNWEYAPLASVGVLTNIAEDGTYFDCLFPAYPSVDAHMKFSIVGPFDPYRYTPGTKGGIEFRPYRNEHFKESADKKSDEKMRELVRELSNILLPKQEKISDQIIRFYTVDPLFIRKYFHVGNCFQFRHYEYDILTVNIEDSTNVTLDNVCIYSSPGSGFVGNGDISGLHFKGCKVMLKPGTCRGITTATDCLHVCNSQGNFIIDSCEFGHAGDDCINIHDNSSMGIEVIDEHSLLAMRVTKQAVRFEVGYPVELRNSDLSPISFTSVLTDVEYFPDQRTCKLTFKDALPENLPSDTVLWNKRFHTQNYIIRNCRFTNNRARGVLLQGSNGLLENNLFENIQGAAIQIETGCESRWSEGHGVQNLII